MILVRKASEVRKRREIKFLNHNRPSLCFAIDWVCSNAVVSPEASSSNSTLIFIIFSGEVDSGAADYKFGKFWDEEEWEALLLSKGTLKWSDIVLFDCSRGKFMFKQLLSKNTRNFESFLWNAEWSSEKFSILSPLALPQFSLSRMLNTSNKNIIRSIIISVGVWMWLLMQKKVTCESFDSNVTESSRKKLSPPTCEAVKSRIS